MEYKYIEYKYIYENICEGIKLVNNNFFNNDLTKFMFIFLAGLIMILIITLIIMLLIHKFFDKSNEENKNEELKLQNEKFFKILGKDFFVYNNLVYNFDYFIKNFNNIGVGNLHHYFIMEKNNELFVFFVDGDYLDIKCFLKDYHLKYYFLSKNLTEEDVDYFIDNYVFSLKEHYLILQNIIDNDDNESLELFKNKIKHNIRDVNTFDIDKKSKKNTINQINQIEEKFSDEIKQDEIKQDNELNKLKNTINCIKQ